MEKLTDKQAKILRFVVHRQQETGYPPTVREIAAEFGFRSPKAASDHLAALERVAGLRFPTGELARKAAATTEHLNALVAANPEHAAMVAELERRAPDAEAGLLIDGDELVAEVEEFLRDEGT